VSKEPGASPVPGESVSPATTDTGMGPVRSTITYDVKLNGKSHKVTVSPA
jgi:methylmalonyl-CoA carboxyltransferase 5S subunit